MFFLHFDVTKWFLDFKLIKVSSDLNICYVIVEFVKEKSLVVVPLTWLNKKGHAFWPLYNNDKS